MKTPEHFDVEPLPVRSPDMREAPDDAAARALAAVGRTVKAPAGLAAGLPVRACRRDS